MTEKRKHNSTPKSGIYDVHYYENACGGYTEYNKTLGEVLPSRQKYILDKANIQPNERILDIGTGRGEIAYHSAKQGSKVVGLDYSLASIKFAGRLKEKAKIQIRPFELILADAKNLPFGTNMFDVIFLLDIVEHLSPPDLKMVLKQVKRCLRTNGRLIIHTMPNLNYYRWGYPMFRFFARLIGKNLPKDPRKRSYLGETHINIQTPNSLKENLNKTGFHQINVELMQLSGSKLKIFLCNLPIIRNFLSNDIIAVAK